MLSGVRMPKMNSIMERPCSSAYRCASRSANSIASSWDPARHRVMRSSNGWPSQPEQVKYSVAGTPLHSADGRFAAANTQFLGLTYQRAASYWDCYHRNQFADRRHYPSFLPKAAGTICLVLGRGGFGRLWPPAVGVGDGIQYPLWRLGPADAGDRGCEGFDGREWLLAGVAGQGAA